MRSPARCLLAACSSRALALARSLSTTPGMARLFVGLLVLAGHGNVNILHIMVQGETGSHRAHSRAHSASAAARHRLATAPSRVKSRRRANHRQAAARYSKVPRYTSRPGEFIQARRQPQPKNPPVPKKHENYAILKGMDRTTLTDFFEEVETTEEYNGYFCSIAEAISIVVLGSLCGFKNVSQIHQWAESAHAREFLKEKFGIKHVPCYYWLLVLLKMVKPDTLNTCLMKWAAQYLPADRSQTTISLDGKTIRSTTGMKNIESPMHIISAQICEFGVTLASETVDEKSNEIPAVQELLKKTGY